MTQYIVKLRCVVTKQVTYDGCTEDEAEKDPFEFAVDEVEVDQHDWQVIDIQEAP